MKVSSMRHRMNKSEAVAFARRWKRVNDAERAELRSTPIEHKLRQLASLMASVDQFGWTNELGAEVDKVRRRWQKLRKAYGFRS
jgi:hypothetical protein